MPWDLLQPYVATWGETAFAMWLGGSPWRIAAILTIHLFGITMLLGTVILSSLRLLGWFQRQKPIAQLDRELRPVRRIGLVLTLLGGFLVFTGGALSYWSGYWFRTKLELLAMAMLFHVIVYHRVVRTNRQGFPVLHRATGVVMLLLWFSVGWAGRAIGFF